MSIDLLAWLSLASVSASWVALVAISANVRKCNGGCKQGRAPCVCTMQEWE